MGFEVLCKPNALPLVRATEGAEAWGHWNQSPHAPKMFVFRNSLRNLPLGS